MRSVPQSGVDLIKQIEKCYLRTYDDKNPNAILSQGSKVEGKLTGGWGHTGSDLRIGMPISQSLADSWFTHDLDDKVILPIYKKIGDVVNELTDNQYGALCSFVFNLGTGDPKKPEWTIWKRLRAKQFDQVPQEMAKFVNWDGQRSLGLVRRRAAEQILWATDEPGTLNVNPSSATTRREPTPPTPADPVPVVKSATVISGLVGIVASAPPLINQGIQAVQPYADHSPMVQHILGLMSIVGAASAVLALTMSIMLKQTARH